MAPIVSFRASWKSPWSGGADIGSATLRRPKSTTLRSNQTASDSRRILGVRDARVNFDAPELVGTTAEPPLIARGTDYQVFAVRWPAFGDVHGEGLLLTPLGRRLADVVAIPDADQTPEMLAGLVAGVPRESQFARRLCESGCRVLVPVLIRRGATEGKISDREILYRSAFEMGRHIIGYEVQKVLAGVDWFSKDASAGPAQIGVIGWGEGGMLALYAAALDPRIGTVCVSGYFDSRQNVWREPIYRNVFGLLEQFGDAELAAMIAPRHLVVEAARGPELVVPPGTGGAPGRLVTPKLDDVRSEVARARQLVKGFNPSPPLDLVESGDGAGSYGSPRALQAFLSGVSPGATLVASGDGAKLVGKPMDTEARQRRQFHELDLHNQDLLLNGPNVRKQFFAKLDTSSSDAFRKSVEPYREYFAKEVIGRFDDRPMPPHPRTRKSYEGKNWIGYEVVLDVYPDVFAYGVLLVPKDLKPGERRPVVVCQHGLEGRPTDTILGDSRYYHDFAAHLADRGFITSRAAESLSVRRPFPHVAAQGQPDPKNPVFDHRAATPADRRLAGELAVCRSAADRFLRAIVRRQDGDARAAVGERLLPCHLLRRFQRLGREERLQPRPRIQLRLAERIRDIRIRPGEHVQLFGDGGPDRAAALHGRARAF